MPPSPPLRCSPGRDHRMENTHKRGRSFESGLPLNAQDDDLALFNDMQNRERENFLLHTYNDSDDSLSKLRYFSDLKLGITIPVRRESSDLLNADGEKNDYDWLLTPPDTPLFPSLDDDEPQPHNLPPRGRAQSQPINISRSSSMAEKTRRTSRSSASPCRLSPSPRSNNSLAPLRGRPSLAPCSSPPPVLRPTTPSRMPSTPNKPSAPTPRSSTPTLRRLSTGSSGMISTSIRRGASPIKTSHGNSASPKIQGWQSSLPGFSSDAPPNLRTSVSDRPASHVRGLSPISRNGRGRQSMSPTASRSASSSHIQERDRFSSYSKGSAVSSGDDDVDSPHSVTVGIFSSPTARGGPVNNGAMAFSKKPSRSSSASTAPKRSFDSVLRQMDQRKAPQNMFRPLLSSVPATTFYVGKANSMHRPLFSRNSSHTTCTSASSEQGANVAPDMDGSEHDQSDLAGEWERMQDPDIQEEVFIFDKVDEIIGDSGHELFGGKSLSGNSNFDEGMTNKVESEEFESSMVKFGDTASIATASESSYAAVDHSEVDCCEIIVICSKCGKHFKIDGVNGDRDCQECAEKDGPFVAGESWIPLTVTQDEMIKSEVAIGMDSLCNDVKPNIGVHELPEKSSSEVILDQHEGNIEEGPDCLMNRCPLQLVMDQRVLHLSDQKLNSKQEMSVTQSDSGSKVEQTQHTTHPSLRVESSEGTGISVLLLQRSSSSKWPVVQGWAFSATNILCSDPSYSRDNTSAMKRSIGRDSASACSVDLGSSRQAEARFQRQLSNRSEMDSMRCDTDAKAQCIDSHLDDSVDAYEPLLHSKNGTEENFNSFVEGVDNEALQETVLVTIEHKSLDHIDLGAAKLSSMRPDFVDGDVYVHADSCMSINTPKSQLLSSQESIHYETSAADNLKDEDCTSCINTDEDLLKSNERSIQDIEVPTDIPDSSDIEEDCVLNGIACQSDISDAATSSSSVVILDSQNDHESFQDPQTECAPSHIPSNLEAVHEHSVSTTSEKGLFISTLESDIIDHVHGIHEESTVMVEGPRGHTSRSLSLEEATDTILFCSSIIHDIAYKAASIGMKKELVPPETSRPTVMILGKYVPGQQDSRKMSTKHMPKSQKFKRKRLETQTKSPPTDLGNNGKVQQQFIPSDAEIPYKGVDIIKPPKLESKCNCTVM